MSNAPLPYDKVISLLMHYCFANLTTKAIAAAHGVTGPCVCKYARRYRLPQRWNANPNNFSIASAPRSRLYARKNYAPRPRVRAWRADAQA